jgi:anti-sigma factor RsiW
MTCEEARVSMHFHLDGDEHLHVLHARAHTESCRECHAHVSTLQTIEQSLRALSRHVAPSGLKESVLSMAATMPQKQPLRNMYRVTIE